MTIEESGWVHGSSGDTESGAEPGAFEVGTENAGFAAEGGEVLEGWSDDTAFELGQEGFQGIVGDTAFEVSEEGFFVEPTSPPDDSPE